MFAKYRRWILPVLALAVFGWIKLHPQRPPAPAAQPASATAAADSTPAITRRLGQLAFTPCTLASGFGTQTVEAQCSSLQVQENRAAPNGRKISLAIAWLPAKGEAKPDPLFMLAGGPGQSALESFPGIAPAFAELRKKRDIILVDQRGTGGSNKLICKDSEGKSAAVEDEDYGLTAAKAFAARCAAELSKKADLRFYSTTDAIQDLDTLRAAIGAAQINLMGVSYGTRVAQQYAKRYPTRTRTVTIDGIVPNTLILGNDHAKNLESSLDRQFGRCAQDKGCAEKLGNPRARLNALMTLLKTAPPMVRYRDGYNEFVKQPDCTPHHVIVGLATAGLTAFYMSRALWVAVFGPKRAHQKGHGHGHDHAHESPLAMTGPLMVLAVLSVIAGFLGLPAFFHGEHAEPEAMNMIVAVTSTLVALTGLGLGTLVYARLKGKEDPLKQKLGAFYTFLVRKYYLDEAFQTAADVFQKSLANVLFWFDTNVVMKRGVDGAAGLTGGLASLIRRAQTGRVQNYALAFAMGVAGLAFFMATQGGH